ncbi:type 1 fimbrial protein [Buttiauxella sp. 3AFRM03]|uniref:fimbrial protein n=1 Tax=Buttiauxella sp. 3AFRM03 TaxID=2479367 RepID=UPI000EF77607|nr:fimbrial protein [Buttiauxella sp. 3AFRM03]AYN25851.1 type 1 fimbrial protein [Buttiauxella sp. 3AFRM03]
MSVIRSALLLVGLLPVGFNVSANCNMSSQRIIAAPETIVMKRAVQSGAVLHSRTYRVQNIPSPNCSGSVAFSAQIVGDKSALILPGVLRSNVKGVGVKVSLELSSGRIILWPSEFSAALDELKGSKITIELIKTDDNINVGALPGNINLQIKSEHQSLPVIDINLPATYINLLNHSCWVNNKRANKVNLSDAALKNFTQPGSVAGIKPFDVKFICDGGGGAVRNVDINWWGIQTAENRSYGVLRNQDESGAQGIGIQMLDENKKPVNFDSRKEFALKNLGEGHYAIPLFARYYQYGQKVTPGKISTFIYFNIIYQ